jgi:Fe-S-cluster-containing hydrogenase component 2
VEAIGSTGPGKHGHAQVTQDLCLGCGVCVKACPGDAVSLDQRAQRVVTPVNTAHRVLLMAIERGTLQHVIFDNQVLHSHRALAALLGALLKLPPVKRILAGRQLKSRYLEALVDRFQWQPVQAACPNRPAD